MLLYGVKSIYSCHISFAQRPLTVVAHVRLIILIE